MFPKNFYYMSIENGNLVSYWEMLVEAEELYDFGDTTNMLEIWEYYELTNIPCDPRTEYEKYRKQYIDIK